MGKEPGEKGDNYVKITEEALKLQADQEELTMISRKTARVKKKICRKGGTGMEKRRKLGPKELPRPNSV